MHMYVCIYIYTNEHIHVLHAYICACTYMRDKEKNRERALIDGYLSLLTVSAIGEVTVLFTATYPLFSSLFSIL